MKDEIKATLIFYIVIIIALVILIIAALFAPNDCHAQEVEIDVGRSLYVNGHDGFWYQEGMDHKLDYRATSFEIGSHYPLWQGDAFMLDYGTAWNYLGQMHMQSYAVQDANYNLARHRCYDPCGHEADFFGSGHNQGISLALEPSYAVGDTRFGVETGAYVYKNTFAENIKQYGGNNAPPVTNITLNATDTLGITIGKVVGVSMRRYGVVFKYQYFVNADHFAGINTNTQNFPAAWHGTSVISLGYKF